MCATCVATELSLLLSYVMHLITGGIGQRVELCYPYMNSRLVVYHGI